MSGGIRVEIRVESPGVCPMADMSVAAESACRQLSKTSIPDATGRVTEEFLTPRDTNTNASDDQQLDASDPDAGISRVFAYDDAVIYRVSRRDALGCVCERIEANGCPVHEVEARNGTLYITFHVPDLDVLRSVLKGLRANFDGVSVRRLLGPDTNNGEQEFVLVDRGVLTARQREVLHTAHELGYFDHPKGANAGEVAAALGITTSTFTEILSAAQRNLHGPILDHL